MTNGEKIKEIFPNAEIDKGKDGNDIWIAIDCWTTFTKEWWNAEYKEPNTGHWIDKQCLFDSCSAECSSCHKRSSGYVYDNGLSLESKYYDFCPKCGCKMVEL